jgi:hypothetical protein
MGGGSGIGSRRGAFRLPIFSCDFLFSFLRNPITLLLFYSYQCLLFVILLPRPSVDANPPVPFQISSILLFFFVLSRPPTLFPFFLLFLYRLARPEHKIAAFFNSSYISSSYKPVLISSCLQRSNRPGTTPSISRTTPGSENMRIRFMMTLACINAAYVFSPRSTIPQQRVRRGRLLAVSDILACGGKGSRCASQHVGVSSAGEADLGHRDTIPRLVCVFSPVKK